LVISPFANLSFNIVFASFSEVGDVLDLVNPEARVEMNAPVIPIPTSIPSFFPRTIHMTDMKVISLAFNISVIIILEQKESITILNGDSYW
jgi:hypothetical protein